jgi:hypothetical protein
VGTQRDLNRNLLIFNDRIFDSRVEAGMPKTAAAPEGPDTLPADSAKAASIFCFSWTADILARGWLAERALEDSIESQLGSTEKVSVSQTMTDRSMTFWSSRIFPGQEYY